MYIYIELLHSSSLQNILFCSRTQPVRTTHASKLTVVYQAHARSHPATNYSTARLTQIAAFQLDSSRNYALFYIRKKSKRKIHLLAGRRPKPLFFIAGRWRAETAECTRPDPALLRILPTAIHPPAGGGVLSRSYFCSDLPPSGPVETLSNPSFSFARTCFKVSLHTTITILMCFWIIHSSLGLIIIMIRCYSFSLGLIIFKIRCCARDV